MIYGANVSVNDSRCPMICRGNESQDVHVSTRVGVSGARHGGRIPKRMDVAVGDADYRPVLS